jgi:hypothetical protein
MLIGQVDLSRPDREGGVADPAVLLLDQEHLPCTERRRVERDRCSSIADREV